MAECLASFVVENAVVAELGSHPSLPLLNGKVMLGWVTFSSDASVGIVHFSCGRRQLFLSFILPLNFSSSSHHL